MTKSEGDTSAKTDIFDSTNFRGAATQKVKDFVLEQARQSNRTKPWRLPPMRKLAEHLGVSVATVQAAYRKLSEEGVIRTDRNRASYVTPLRNAEGNRLYHIGIDFLKGDENLNRSWRGNLHGGMLQQALSQGNRIVFHQIPPGSLTKDDLYPDDLEAGLDGVILAMHENARTWPTLDAGIPAVFHSPADLDGTANFVSADLYGAAKRAGRAFEVGNRKRPYIATHTDLDRAEFGWHCAGLAAGYHEHKVGWHQIGTLHFGSDDAHEVELVKDLFENTARAPDAIYCQSDYTAMRILKIFKKLEIDVPGQVSVIGGTGLILMHTEFFTMTRAFQPLQEIGSELVNRLVKLIDGDIPVKEFPGVFLPCRFGGGATTTAAENEVLGIEG